MGLKEELSEMRMTMEKLTIELHETNLAIRESLKLTSDTIKEMSDTFSKTLGDTLKVMQDMRVQVDIRDSVLKGLGIENLIPEFLKKKSKWTKTTIDLYLPISNISVYKFNAFLFVWKRYIKS